MNHDYIHVGIIALTLLTAIIHLMIGLSESDNLLVLNGLGYVALLIALYIPFQPMQNYRTWFRNTLIVYTVITIIGYFALHGGIPTTHAHGGADATNDRPDPAEVLEGDNSETDNLESEGMSSQQIQGVAVQVDSKKVQPDYMGLGVKGIEGLLLGLLVADRIIDKKVRRADDLVRPE